MKPGVRPFARAVMAFLALPGTVAFAVPALLLNDPAPWSPPRHLVVSGLYRYSRNPMYVSVALILWGWAAAFHSAALMLYALGVMTAFHLRVVLGEEPWLARTHGDAWDRYKSAVPRWFGRRQA